MNSGLIISRGSDRPVYRQIMDQIKRRVSSGDMKPGSELPSIRNLAIELRVSVITVRRAYLELEREHVVRTLQGRGSFVSDGNLQLDQRLQREELEHHLRRATELATSLDGSDSELACALKKIEHIIRRTEQ